MTSPNTGLRRTALVVLAVGATLGASACSAGQISQTADQVAAVDGGQGTSGGMSVNDLRVVLPGSGEGEARVGFTISHNGYGLDEPVSIERVEIDGEEVQFGETAPLERDCSVVATTEESEAPPAEGVCIEHVTATLPSADDLTIAQSAPATVSFSSGDVIETSAGVIAEPTGSGDFTRPAAPTNPEEGH